MTLKELEEQIPHITTIQWTMGKSIINFEDGRCWHVAMPRHISEGLEVKLLQDMLLRVKHRCKKPKNHKNPKSKPHSQRMYRKPFDREKFAEMYNSGLAYVEIASILNVPLGSVQEMVYTLRKCNMIGNRIKYSKYDKLLIENKHKKVVEISREFGIEKDILYRRVRLLKERGIL